MREGCTRLCRAAMRARARPASSRRTTRPLSAGGALAEGDVLGELADGTGGTFFHNNNDLVEGFRQTGATPEFMYVLGFSPQNLKFDGSYHSLKVTAKETTGCRLAGAPRLLCAQTCQRSGGGREGRDSRGSVFARRDVGHSGANCTRSSSSRPTPMPGSRFWRMWISSICASRKSTAGTGMC